jgi:hypothetical protein
LEDEQGKARATAAVLHRHRRLPLINNGRRRKTQVMRLKGASRENKEEEDTMSPEESKEKLLLWVFVASDGGIGELKSYLRSH